MVEMLRAFVEERTPLNRALGLRLVATAPGEATCLLPYAPALVGDAETGAVHGGAITTLVDVTCGSAACMKMARLRRIVTLELRIDHLRPSRSGKDLAARAECYELTPSVAFVRGLVHDGDAADAVATMQATYMLVEE
ncbi:PaaI family thioesterase [Hyalangium rubrum]|uniref:PaaI family thioesterase n=1 Tax=Hyalangium rubrum TaxID=3103134 RepID=A0ABU5H2R9_9BACT|nr:PaaI family thioesterase [Hyalangium sp. s54d21]MDY7227765.1 PaaI family thioesterase [Hyalangium sp. s54d21]